MKNIQNILIIILCLLPFSLSAQTSLVEALKNNHYVELTMVGGIAKYTAQVDYRTDEGLAASLSREENGTIVISEGGPAYKFKNKVEVLEWFNKMGFRVVDFEIVGSASVYLLERIN